MTSYVVIPEFFTKDECEYFATKYKNALAPAFEYYRKKNMMHQPHVIKK